MSGLAHIAAAFAAARAESRAALMPYYTLGYPDRETSLRVVRAVAEAGADLIELGVPFSDPLADGPTIQRSTQVALQAGATVRRCLAMTAGLRAAGVLQPLLLMGYINPIMSYGVKRFVEDAAGAGADGFIIPDLPPEEGEEMAAACAARDCAQVYLLAPAAGAERAGYVAGRSTGFLYLVSVTGVTGARQVAAEGLAESVARARDATRTPVAVGFGVSTPEQAAAVGRLADGVIVGSALIDSVDRALQAASDPAAAAAGFMRGLRSALVK